MAEPIVLVVDDVPAIVEELLTMVELNGIAAAGAADLDEAIQVLERETTIRVISCDVRLDRESGLEIVGRIEAHPVLSRRTFRYLFVTGDQMQLAQIPAARDRAVLSKPVKPATLIETLKSMLAAADG